MLLTIATTCEPSVGLAGTGAPATDLGYLLGKKPARVQSFSLSFGRGHVFYPAARPERCEVALLLEIDPLDQVRGARRKIRGESPLTQYVNDRPYAASTYLAVAIGRILRTAMRGESTSRPELAAAELPLEVTVAAVRAPDPDTLRQFFEPLGYTVAFEVEPLDPSFPEWGPSPFGVLRLAGTVRLSALLQHLYVLLAALDPNKHYFVDEDEVTKLVDKGGEWLAEHPHRAAIVSRYLKRRRGLARKATEQLDALIDDDVVAEDESEDGTTSADREEAALERPITLNQRRLSAVVDAVVACGAQSVVDLGCGGGSLLIRLLRDTSVRAITGVDVAPRVLEVAARRLHLDRMTPTERARVTLRQGSAVYADSSIAGADCLCAVEVIEHLDPWRLDAFEVAVFDVAAPGTVIVTTPNREYNALFPTLPAGEMRHNDHRFEWTRAEFEGWANAVAGRRGYSVSFHPIGDVDPTHGGPTQMATFTRGAA